MRNASGAPRSGVRTCLPEPPNGKMRDDGFERWLQDRHRRMVTPRAVVGRYIRRAVGSGLASCRRLVIGQMNEVYDVTTESGHRLIVRISHEEDPRFEAERWAMDAARLRGVPTPRVLLVEAAQGETGSITFCVEERLPGVPLDSLLTKGAERPERAITQIGEVLGRIHSVAVEGFGYLQADGRGWDIPFSQIMLDLLGKEAELQQAALRWSIPSRKVEQGLRLLEAHACLYEWDAPVLVHGDFGPDHILVEGDRITGILDFQECSGNHPVLDLAHWDGYWDEAIPTHTLRASYSHEALRQDTQDPLFHLALLRESLWMTMVYAERDCPRGIEASRRGIDRALRFLSGGSAA